MAKLYFRGMAGQNGKPRLGRSARCLGIRPGIDIDVESLPLEHLDERGYLISEVEQNSAGNERVEVAIRNHKGMSTSLSIEGLPEFRRPPKFGGKGRDPLWQMDDSDIHGDLEAVQDSDTHVSIMPSTTMALERYEAALASTQDSWTEVK